MNQPQPSKMPPPLIAAAALCGCWLLLGIVEAGLNYCLAPRSRSLDFRAIGIVYWEIPFWVMCYLPALLAGALFLEYWPSQAKPERFPMTRNRRSREWTILSATSLGLLIVVVLRWTRLADVVHRLAT